LKIFLKENSFKDERDTVVLLNRVAFTELSFIHPLSFVFAISK